MGTIFLGVFVTLLPKVTPSHPSCQLLATAAVSNLLPAAGAEAAAYVHRGQISRREIR